MFRKIIGLLVGTVLLLILAEISPLLAQQNAREVARGKYLVNSIAQCSDCHSPHLANGEPDKAHWLEGGTLLFAPIHPVPNWKTRAPDLAGLSHWKASDAVRLFEDGVWPNGDRPDPPMPAFHMTSQDARAVVAYLKSLAPAKK